MSDDHPDVPNRRSMRLPTYNYRSSGAYFVTICTENRQRFFAQPDLHPYLLEVWHSLPKQFPGIELDEFVIMPDHLHFIVWLDRTAKNPLSLSRVVQAYKSLTALTWLKQNKARGIPSGQHLWQRGYYDHIIRNDHDLDATRQYIRDNPSKKRES